MSLSSMLQNPASVQNSESSSRREVIEHTLQGIEHLKTEITLLDKRIVQRNMDSLMDMRSIQLLQESLAFSRLEVGFLITEDLDEADLVEGRSTANAVSSDIPSEV